MREEIRAVIHELDQTADDIRNPVLLEGAAAVRETLKDMPEEESEGVVSHEWMKQIRILLREESHGKTQLIPDLLRVLTEPAVRFTTETFPEESAGIRTVCGIQRNRMKFVQKLEPYISRLEMLLPETEWQEEEERLTQEKHLASEGLDHLLALYRQKAAEELSAVRMKKIRLLERYEMKEDEKECRMETEERIRVQRSMLHDAEEDFQNIFNSRRTNRVHESLYKCRQEGRRENSVRRSERIDESDEEQTSAEGDRKQDRLQAQPEQPGGRRKEAAEGCERAETAGGCGGEER